MNRRTLIQRSLASCLVFVSGGLLGKKAAARKVFDHCELRNLTDSASVYFQQDCTIVFYGNGHIEGFYVNEDFVPSTLWEPRRSMAHTGQMEISGNWWFRHREMTVPGREEETLVLGGVEWTSNITFTATTAYWKMPSDPGAHLS